MPETALNTKGKERLYYADWLRVLTILTLIPYHSALTYRLSPYIKYLAVVLLSCLSIFLIYEFGVRRFYQALKRRLRSGGNKAGNISGDSAAQG